MPRGAEVQLPDGRIIRHEIEYDRVYAYNHFAPLAHIMTRQTYECSEDGGVTWRYIAGVELRRDDEGDHILVIELDDSRFREAMDRMAESARRTSAHVEELSSHYTVIQDDSWWDYEDEVGPSGDQEDQWDGVTNEGPGLTIDELLGNIDGVLSEHEEAKNK